MHPVASAARLISVSCLWIIAALCAVCLHAADPAADDGRRAKADAEAALGISEMRAADADRTRIVPAALAFTRALRLYEALGDTDRACEMQANVFWCRKKMDVNDLTALLAAQKKPDAKPEEKTELAATVAEMNAVVEKKVEVGEAEAYFKRAEAFAAKSKDDHLLVAARWFEVSTRFYGSDIGKQALERYNAAFMSYSKAADPNAPRAYDTLFTRSSAKRAATQSPLPDAGAQKEATESVKRIFAEQYREASKPDGKQELANRLLAQAALSGDEPAARWAMLSEAARLATESEGWAILFAACDQLAASFAGCDAKAVKASWLGRSTNRLATGPMLKLLDDPQDAEANEAVGSLFILRGGSFDLGLPMWTRAKDPGLSRLAAQELAGTRDPAGMIEIADAWFALGKPPRPPSERDVCYARARVWYEKAAGRLTGFTADRVASRIKEINAVVPPPVGDWSRPLTVKQWEQLKGKVVEIPANIGAKETAATVPEGYWRLVPHPTATWTFLAAGQPKVMDYRGIDGLPHIGWRGRVGQMLLRVAGKDIQPNQVCIGPGRLEGGAEWAGVARANSVRGTGSIKLKLVPATAAELTPVEVEPDGAKRARRDARRDGD